jgi:glutamate synthase (NADPH/NADH) large chain
VASCSFNAIEVVVQRQSMTVSEQNQPSPVRRQLALAIIKQKKDLAYMCRGCGMCERVCPNNAIRPVRNPDDRKALLSRDNGPIKRGGRTNLNAQRTLDSIIVGRISQMTDPALDSVRHTFDIRAPFGRVLPAKDLPFEIKDGKDGATWTLNK